MPYGDSDATATCPLVGGDGNGPRMSWRSRPPFRADHVGSLLRPPAVLAARAELAAGRITADQSRRVEDEAVTAIVRAQEDVGLQTATDGEFRRGSWHMDFIYQLGGVAPGSEQLAVHFRNAAGPVDFTAPALRIHDKVTLDHPIFGPDFTFLQSLTTTATAKLTIPSPSMVHYRGGPAAIDAGVYPDMEEFWADLSAA